jgi:hypothetical protein
MKFFGVLGVKTSSREIKKMENKDNCHCQDVLAPVFSPNYGVKQIFSFLTKKSWTQNHN